MKHNWQWLIWQVGVPLGGPVILSWLIVLAWQTGNPGFVPKWNVILDVSPWALTSYSLTLIGASMNDLWPKIPSHPFIGCSLIVTALMITIYTAFMVIWRHNDHFLPGRSVYLLTGALLLVAIPLCYFAYLTEENI
ncbi:MAG: hypothetical protein JSR66_10305 [Proteobacteria bacterium]|nr:hypothetical protein [Pseudomonadota bacterium]